MPMMSKSKLGRRLTPRDVKTEKKPYSSPTLVELDARAAKAKLKAMGDPRDATTQKMLSLIEYKLATTKTRPDS